MKKTSLLFIALIGLISILLVFTTVGGVNAALQIKSDAYNSEFAMKDIGITLQEKGEKDSDFIDVGWRNYIINNDQGQWNKGNQELFSSINPIEYGRQYSEQFRVVNSGTIDEYVRVKIYKYWLNADDTKNYQLDPSLIVLKLGDTELKDLKGENNGWIVDSGETTTERVTMYYTMPIANGKATGLFADSLTIDISVGELTKNVVKEETIDDVTYTTYSFTGKYDGKYFCVEMEADAIQTHNVDKAIKSVWGRNVTIDKSTKKLSLSD